MLKKRLTDSGWMVFVVSVCVLFFCACEAAEEARVRKNINKGWKYTAADDSNYKGDYLHDSIATGYSEKDFDDSGWDDVHLPHNFDVPFWGGYFQTNDTCWYRKHFTVGSELEGKRVSLEFEGVYQHCYIWINGKFAGEHKGGYTGFVIDVTDFATFGGDNVAAIKVSNEWIGDDRYITLGNWAEYSKFGGIYRNVHLLVTDELHIDFAGTYAYTPTVSESSATVKVETEIINENKNATKNCTLVSKIIDAQGNTVAVLQDNFNIQPGASHTFVQESAAISNPHLWSLDDPYLYKVQTIVMDGKKVVDNYTTPLGFRWYEFNPDKGFFLNGEKIFLRGFNVHQDEYGWGSASVNSKFYRDVQIMKDCGARMIRMSHYPHPRAIYDACDQIGMLVMDEMCFAPSTGGPDNNHGVGVPYTLPDKRAQDYLKSTMRDVVKEHRNHPSIIMMCIANETEGSHSGVSAEEMAKIHRELCDIVHELSPGWLTTSHIRHRGPEGFYQSINDEMDVIGWYGNKAEHAKYPDKCFLPTEAGSYGRGAPGNYTGHGVPAEGWPERPWEVGGTEWCAFSYGSTDYPDGPFLYSNISVIDYNRLGKRDYFWYVNNWLNDGAPEPTWPGVGKPAKIKLTVDKNTIKTDGTDDCMLTATLLNSAGEHIVVENERDNPVMITLAVTKGIANLPGGSVTLPAYTGIGGQTAVSLRSYTPGVVEVTASSPGLESSTIVINCMR